MKLKDFQDNDEMAGIFFRLDDKSLEMFQEYGGGDAEMCFASDSFMTPRWKRSDGSVPLFPIPPGLEFERMAEWETV